MIGHIFIQRTFPLLAAAACSWSLAVARSDPVVATLAGSLAIAFAVILSWASHRTSHRPRSELELVKAKASAKLLTLAVWFLPASQRSRYLEEFIGELEQWGYALRVLAWARKLRRALKEAEYGAEDDDALRVKR